MSFECLNLQQLLLSYLSRLFIYVLHPKSSYSLHLEKLKIHDLVLHLAFHICNLMNLFEQLDLMCFEDLWKDIIINLLLEVLLMFYAIKDLHELIFTLLCMYTF